MVFNAYKIRLYPSDEQIKQMQINFSATHFVWNAFLKMQQERYKNNPKAQYVNAYAMDRMLTTFKKEQGNEWLKQADSTCLQYILKDLDAAYQSLFTHRGRHPRFKGFSYTNAYRTTGKTVIKYYMPDDENNPYDAPAIKLPKLGIVKLANNRYPVDMPIKSVTLRQNAKGWWYTTLLTDVGEFEPLPKTGKQIGIDLNLSEYTLSDGTTYEFPKYYESLEKSMNLWKRRMAKRYLNAKAHIRKNEHLQTQGLPTDNAKYLSDFPRYQQARRKVAGYSQRITNQRYRYLHKVTTDIVRKYDTIVIEDLRVNNMMKNHHLARAVANAGFFIFRTQLEYKCARYGKELIVVSARMTSQTCAECGYLLDKDERLTLADREWDCPACHAHLNRDINAAKNILTKGLN